MKALQGLLLLAFSLIACVSSQDFNQPGVSGYGYDQFPINYAQSQYFDQQNQNPYRQQIQQQQYPYYGQQFQQPQYQGGQEQYPYLSQQTSQNQPYFGQVRRGFQSPLHRDLHLTFVFVVPQHIARRLGASFLEQQLQNPFLGQGQQNQNPYLQQIQQQQYPYYGQQFQQPQYQGGQEENGALFGQVINPWQEQGQQQSSNYNVPSQTQPEGEVPQQPIYIVPPQLNQGQNLGVQQQGEDNTEQDQQPWQQPVGQQGQQEQSPYHVLRQSEGTSQESEEQSEPIYGEGNSLFDFAKPDVNAKENKPDVNAEENRPDVNAKEQSSGEAPVQFVYGRGYRSPYGYGGYSGYYSPYVRSYYTPYARSYVTPYGGYGGYGGVQGGYAYPFGYGRYGTVRGGYVSPFASGTYRSWGSRYGQVF